MNNMRTATDIPSAPCESQRGVISSLEDCKSGLERLESSVQELVVRLEPIMPPPSPSEAECREICESSAQSPVSQGLISVIKRMEECKRQVNYLLSNVEV